MVRLAHRAMPLALCITGSLAYADDIRIVVDATVSSILGTPPAPFTGAAVGDSVVMDVQVFDVPNPSGPNLWGYSLEIPSCTITIGANSSGIDPQTGTDTVVVRNDTGPPGDLLLVSCILNATGDNVLFQAFDYPGTLLPSVDLSQCIGTYGPFVPGLTQIEFRDSAGITVVADTTSFRIEVSTAPVGTAYCSPAIPNTTGASGTITASGSSVLGADDVLLTANHLPPGQFGYFLTSMAQGSFTPPGSPGVLCLSGNIGRYNGDIGTGPSFSLQLDLGAIPVNPPVPVQVGQTWNFQAWYRDIGSTNNFTDAVSITFL